MARDSVRAQLHGAAPPTACEQQGLLGAQPLCWVQMLNVLACLFAAPTMCRPLPTHNRLASAPVCEQHLLCTAPLSHAKPTVCSCSAGCKHPRCQAPTLSLPSGNTVCRPAPTWKRPVSVSSLYSAHCMQPLCRTQTPTMCRPLPASKVFMHTPPAYTHVQVSARRLCVGPHLPTHTYRE